MTGCRSLEGRERLTARQLNSKYKHAAPHPAIWEENWRFGDTNVGLVEEEMVGN